MSGKLTPEEIRDLFVQHSQRRDVTGVGLSNACITTVADIMATGGNVVIDVATGQNAVSLQVSEIDTVILVLDVSGSMIGQEHALALNANRMIEDLAGRGRLSVPPHITNKIEVTIVTFSGNGVNVIRANQPVSMCQPIDVNELRMGGSTPLYKTVMAVMAGGVSRGEALRSTNVPIPYRKTNRVILAVVTDDGNTLTREVAPDGRTIHYTADAVQRMSRELMATERWTLAIAVAGNEGDVDPIADKLGFTNRRHIDKSDDGWAEFFELLSKRSLTASLSATSNNNTFLS